MRTSTLLPCALTAVALALAGCSATDPGADPTTPPPTSPGTPPATNPSAPTPSATPTTAPATDVPPDAMLPETSWTGTEGGRQDAAGVVDWRLPEACAVGAPEGATAMRTVQQGDGEVESQVGVQQVALFADADAAVAEADRLAAALTACTTYAFDTETTYVVEPLDVGAQGTGLATDYYGASADGDLDTAMGSYLASTRRGTAVTVVALEGGESTVGDSRATVTAQAQAAWDLLCAYDSAGC